LDSVPHLGLLLVSHGLEEWYNVALEILSVQQISAIRKEFEEAMAKGVWVSQNAE
jgi:hypothetical protein